MAKGPIRTSQTALKINGIQTDVFSYTFHDKVLIIVTQYSKLGTLLYVKPQAGTSTSWVTSSSNSLDDATIQMSTFLLGHAALDSTRSELYQLYASRIAKVLSTLRPGEAKPLVLGLALRNNGHPNTDGSGTPDPFVFSKILEMVKQVL